MGCDRSMDRENSCLKANITKFVNKLPLFLTVKTTILGLQPRDKEAMFEVNTKVFIFLRRIYMKIKFSSQKRDMLLFLTTNMAAVTSRANQQYLDHR